MGHHTRAAMFQIFYSYADSGTCSFRSATTVKLFINRVLLKTRYVNYYHSCVSLATSSSFASTACPSLLCTVHAPLPLLCSNSPPPSVYSNGVSGGEEDDWDYSERVDPNKEGVPVKALYDYDGVEGDELSFKSGEVSNQTNLLKDVILCLLLFFCFICYFLRMDSLHVALVSKEMTVRE